MADPKVSMIAAIKHFLTYHPEIAPEIELFAARQQGRSDQDFLNFAEWKRYENLSTQQVFEKIYEEGEWGKSGSQDAVYYSGLGSHDPAMIDAYVASVATFLQSLGQKPTAVDIGCGDFNVGSKLRGYCSRYTAVDIASPVIAFNKTRFADADVDFAVLNVIEEKPPRADVIFIRQVLQHLSNSEITRALANIAGQCDHFIVTEHLPAGEFTPNLNKTTGRGIRLRHGSGVVISEPPFSFAFHEQKVLCEVPGPGGVIRTTLYSM